MQYSRLDAITSRRLFDPTQKEDLQELKHYVETGQWIGSCPFYLEDFWDNIPVMCMHKYTRYMLSNTKSPK